MKSVVGCAGLISVTCVVAFGLFRSGDAGKTIKLPFYDVTFGSWPLMEVTKTGYPFRKAPRHFKGKSIGPPGIGGPRGIGGPPGVGGPPDVGGPPGIGGPPKGFRLGPPPTGNLVLVNSGDKGMLHSNLQANLKHFSTKPVNLNLPIIVKAPGPHPPPPPHGYKLGPSNGSPPNHPPLKLIDNNSWKPGPLNGAFDSRPNGHPKTSRLFSTLMNAAHSGIFGNGFDAYRTPDFMPEPPYPGPYITNYQDGTQVTTYVNEAVIPGTGSGSGIEAKPSVPPVLKIGDHPPDNYRVIYAQRQIVSVKSPDILENSGNISPGTSQVNLGLNLGGNYEQGYGAPPPTRPPILIQKFQKRGDHVIEKLVEQHLPDTGLIATTNILVSTPNISAPLGGRNSILFQNALDDKKRILKLRKKERPLDAQVKLLGRLFTKLQRIQPPKIAVPEDELDDHKGNVDYDDDDGWKKVGKSKVDSPIMAVQIQTYSAPEINSADPDIIESMAEFGNHDVEFADTDEIVNLMESVMNQGSSRVNIKDLGSNPQEINDNMLNWVRRYLTLSREVNSQAHSKGEELASKQFKQYQTFVRTPGGGNGWGPSDPVEVDPKRGSRTLPMTNTNLGASMRL